MPALRSSVLIIGHPDAKHVAFGADFANHLTEAQEICLTKPYPVVVLPADSGRELEFLDFLNKHSPDSQRVVVQNDVSAEGLRQIINRGQVFKVLKDFDDPQFDRTIQEALEEYNLVKQNAKLLQLTHEQNERLKRLTTELEERVMKRQNFLTDAKQKLLVTNHRVEALHRALVAVHRATSIPEMERLINEALSGALNLSWTRILFHSQSQIENRLERDSSICSLYKSPLMRGKETLGHIYFAREAKMPFTKDESGFLGQIAEAVTLAISRLSKLEQSETLKQQWEATFDAILEPVSLIDTNYNLIRINLAFASQSGVAPEKLIGQKCYTALFGKSAPCETCQLGANFRMKPEKTAGDSNVIYDVFSQVVQFKPESTSLFVNMYHDVASQIRLERQILESAKMAELGTIGSSIAHELNNPLGGMLSFLQLIKMDLKGQEPYYEDIVEMEKGAHRCKEIVQNLLGFTRKPSVEESQAVDLREVVEQALKITELQTRAMGITVTQKLPQEPVTVKGQFNLLAQAVRNFLQNSHEAIAEKLRKQARFHGEIIVQVKASAKQYVIEITDNGIGIDPKATKDIYSPLFTTKDPNLNPGLGLTVALQIVTDHQGTVEISSAPDKGTTAKIAFLRPVL